MNGERDLCLHRCGSERVAGLATKASVIIAGFGPEDVNVTRFPARRLVSGVDLDIVFVPDDLSQRIAAARDALQLHVLTHTDRFTFRVANNFRLPWWIYDFIFLSLVVAFVTQR